MLILPDSCLLLGELTGALEGPLLALSARRPERAMRPGPAARIDQTFNARNYQAATAQLLLPGA